MAAEGNESAAAAVERALSGGDGGSNFAIIVGVMGPMPEEDGTAPPPPERFLLINPATGRIVVLQGEAAAFISHLLSISPPGPLPASKASIAALKTIEAVGAEDCAVCLEEMESGVVKEMPCRHRYHGGCIEKWLAINGSCPVCRHRMPVEEEDGSRKSGGGDDGGGGGGGEVWVTVTVERREEEHGEDEGRDID